jgi:hypothetical protein
LNLTRSGSRTHTTGMVAASVDCPAVHVQPSTVQDVRDAPPSTGMHEDLLRCQAAMSLRACPQETPDASIGRATLKP